MSNFTCSCLLCTDITYNLGHFTGYVQYTARIIHISLCVYSLIMTKTLFFNQNYGFKSSSFVYLVCTCIYNMDRSISCLCFPSCMSGANFQYTAMIAILLDCKCRIYSCHTDSVSYNFLLQLCIFCLSAFVNKLVILQSMPF